MIIESAIELCPKLNNLQLCNTSCGMSACLAMKQALSHSKCILEYVDLSQNGIKDKPFCEMLLGISKQVNKSLKGLVFKQNAISAVSMKVVNIVLKYNTTLK